MSDPVLEPGIVGDPHANQRQGSREQQTLGDEARAVHGSRPTVVRAGEPGSYGFPLRYARACTSSGRGVPWLAISTSFVKLRLAFALSPLCAAACAAP